MKDLYISYDIYDNHLFRRETTIGDQIHSSSNIYVDTDQKEKIHLLDEKTHIHLGADIIKKMKHLEEIENGFSHDLAIFTDINETKAREISKKYGIVCISAEGLETKEIEKIFNDLKFDKTLYLKLENNNENVWADLSPKDKSATNVSCQSIIICDRYFYTEKNNCYNELENILDNLHTDDHIDVLLICGDANWDSLFKKSSPNIPKVDYFKKWFEDFKDYSKTSQKLKKMDVHLECIFIQSTKGEEDIYQYTHNRRVYGSYFVINAEHSIVASINRIQLIGTHSIFCEKGFYFDLLDYELDNLAKNISKVISNKSCRYFSCNFKEDKVVIGETLVDKYMIRNKLIADRLQLRENKICYGIEVEYQPTKGTLINIVEKKYIHEKHKNSFVKPIRSVIIKAIKTILEINNIAYEKNMEEKKKRNIETLKGYIVREEDKVKFIENKIEIYRIMEENTLFFEPYIGSKFATGYDSGAENGQAVKILVLGASFYCDQKDCHNYSCCTKNSKEYDSKCPAEGYAGSHNNGRGMLLHESPQIEVESYLDGDYYPAYDRFVQVILNLNDKPTKEDREKVWDYVMFNNYIQHFVETVSTPKYLGVNKKFYDEDFKGFLTLIERNPIECVIVWGKSVREALTENIRRIGAKIEDLDDKNYNHVVDIKGRRIVLCYFDHPTCRTFLAEKSKKEHYNYFILAMNKVNELKVEKSSNLNTKPSDVTDEPSCQSSSSKTTNDVKPHEDGTLKHDDYIEDEKSDKQNNKKERHNQMHRSQSSSNKTLQDVRKNR